MPDEWGEFCENARPDLTPRETFAKFKDFWTAKPGKDGVKLDWFATWRNWCRAEKQQPTASTPARWTPPQPNETVPSKPGIDPTLAALIADRINTKPPSPEMRAKLSQLAATRT